MTKRCSSQLRKIILAKACLPLLCVVGGGALLDFRNGTVTLGSWLSIPCFVLAFFGASLAILETDGKTVRYKRFLKWISIPTGSIVNVRLEAAPLIGSLQLRRYLFPWGRLYFVLDDKQSVALFRGDYPLIRRLEELLSLKDSQFVGASVLPRQRKRAGVAVAAGLGVVFSAMCQIMARHMPAPSSNGFEQNPPLSVLWQLVHFLHSGWIVAFVSSAFACLAFYGRSRSVSMVSAFLAGAGFSYLIFLLV